MFSGKKVFITGGSTGIGKQLAIDFLRRGAHVTILSNDPVKLEATRIELATIKPSIYSLCCDVGDLEQVRMTAATYIRQFGSPDVLISNAGYAIYRTFDEMPAEEIARLLSVNFIGACVVTRELLPAMLKTGSGNIVVMASIAGRLAMTPCGIYSAAKHGLVAWARTLDIELRRTGIRVHVICPGRVETDFFADESFKMRAPRKETQLTIPVETVSYVTIAAIEKDRFMTCIPRSYGLLVWLANALPFPVGSLFNRLMQARVDSLRPAQESTAQ